jgi:hypothetical protein
MRTELTQIFKPFYRREAAMLPGLPHRTFALCEPSELFISLTNRSTKNRNKSSVISIRRTRRASEFAESQQGSPSTLYGQKGRVLRSPARSTSDAGANDRRWRVPQILARRISSRRWMREDNGLLSS